jgi:hypothetical protein
LNTSRLFEAGQSRQDDQDRIARKAKALRYRLKWESNVAEGIRVDVCLNGSYFMEHI